MSWQLAAAGGLAAAAGPAMASAASALGRRWPWQVSTGWWRGDPAPPRYRWLAAAGVGGGSAIALGVVGARPAAAAYLLMAAAGMCLALIDLQHHLLPNRIVAPAAAACLVLLAVDGAATGSWPALLRGSITAAVIFAVFFVLALISPAGIGLGDVKLAAVFGLLTGWLGWQVALVGVLAAFLLGAVIPASRALARRSWPHRTAVFAFGPALLLGCWLAVLSAG